MKIIIKESRLENLMFAYLEDRLFPHEEVELIDYNYSIFWVKDGLIVAQIMKKWGNKIHFYIKYNVALTFQAVFSLNKIGLRDYILKFLKEKHNLKVNVIFYDTFRYEQEIYDKGHFNII